MLKGRWGFWLTLILGLGFILFFFRGAVLSEAMGLVLRLKWFMVLPGVLAYFLGVGMRMVRWHFLLAHLGRFPLPRLFPPVVIGIAMNNILPGKVGFVVRAYLLGQREKVSKIAAGSTIVVDHLFDGVALLFLLLIISLFIPLSGWAKGIAIAVATINIGLLLISLTMASFPYQVHRLLQPLERRLPPPWQRRVWEWSEAALAGLRVLRHPGTVGMVFFFSIIVWLLEAMVLYSAALALSLDLPFTTALLASTIANLAVFLPSLPGGVGPYEFFGKQTLLILGVRATTATALMAVAHLLILLPITVVGLIALWWQRRPWGEVSRGGVR